MQYVVFTHDAVVPCRAGIFIAREGHLRHELHEARLRIDSESISFIALFIADARVRLIEYLIAHVASPENLERSAFISDLDCGAVGDFYFSHLD